MAITLLILGAIISLPLTAVGLPGAWMLIAGAGLWKSLDPSASIGWGAIGVAFVLAALGEALEWGLSARYTSKYGGSRRAGWGAIVGGLVGAVVGVPIPIIGSIIGSFVGAFVGALLAEYSLDRGHSQAGRVAWGALVGRVFATAAKIGLGVVLAVILVVSALA